MPQSLKRLQSSLRFGRNRSYLTQVSSSSTRSSSRIYSLDEKTRRWRMKISSEISNFKFGTTRTSWIRKWERFAAISLKTTRIPNSRRIGSVLTCSLRRRMWSDLSNRSWPRISKIWQKTRQFISRANGFLKKSSKATGASSLKKHQINR